jgi:hypothetical protein
LKFEREGFPSKSVSKLSIIEFKDVATPPVICNSLLETILVENKSFSGL